MSVEDAPVSYETLTVRQEGAVLFVGTNIRR